MRLLRIAADGSLHPTSFGDDRLPPYAILSHTWGHEDNDEVTFQDMEKGGGKRKPGFEKLEFCRDQAQACGLEYIWVDTCCIDKANNSELTESVNLMFRWYRRAERCFVYLVDVSAETADGQSHAGWTSSFRSSRWFTRGWTLQELLAPCCVEFFSRDRVRLGDKMSLATQLHEITGIALQALRTGDLTAFSVDQRLAWATGRETKKKEDKAYCLLGICDVTMPLVYGEGYEKASIRLRREIAESLAMPEV